MSNPFPISHKPPHLDPVSVPPGVPLYPLYARDHTFTVPAHTLTQEELSGLGYMNLRETERGAARRTLIFDTGTLYPLATILSSASGKHYAAMLTYKPGSYVESALDENIAAAYNSFGIAYQAIIDTVRIHPIPFYNDDRPCVTLNHRELPIRATSMHHSVVDPCPCCGEPSEIVTAYLGTTHYDGARRPTVTLRVHTDLRHSAHHPFVCAETEGDLNDWTNRHNKDYGSGRTLTYCERCRNQVRVSTHDPKFLYVHQDTGWSACSYHDVGRPAVLS